MKFVYFGSFHLSAEILANLIAEGFIPAVAVCSPDRPAGRKHVLTAPAVKTLVTDHNARATTEHQIQILQPESPLEIGNVLRALNPDFFIVMGYPHIISNQLLSIPRLGTIGVHPSLLPKYRGASPIQSVLLAGEKETGVTLYQMDAKMDHGPILAESALHIANGETNASLSHKCAKAAGELLAQMIPDFVAGTITAREQHHAQATFTKKFTTADGEVNMAHDAPETIYRKIKAFNPEPSCWTMNFPGREGKRVKLLAADWNDNELRVTEIQVEGKKPLKLN